MTYQVNHMMTERGISTMVSAADGGKIDDIVKAAQAAAADYDKMMRKATCILIDEADLHRAPKDAMYILNVYATCAPSAEWAMGKIEEAGGDITQAEIKTGNGGIQFAVPFPKNRLKGLMAKSKDQMDGYTIFRFRI